MFPGETILSGAPKDEHVSDFMPLQSGNGWFVGTLYTYCAVEDCERCGKDRLPAGHQLPNTRETGYFKNEIEAEAALAVYEATGELPRRRT